MNEEKAIELLEKQISEVDKLFMMERFSSEFSVWDAKTENLIERFFGKESSHLKNFKKIDYSLRMSSNNTPRSKFEEAYKRGLNKAKSILNAFVEEIKELGLPENNKNSNENMNNTTINNNINNTQNQNQNLNLEIDIKNILKNKLNEEQKKELEEIYKTKDPEEKKSKALEFIKNHGVVAVELLVTIYKTISS